MNAPVRTILPADKQREHDDQSRRAGEREIYDTIAAVKDLRAHIGWWKQSAARSYASQESRDRAEVEIFKLRRQAKTLIAFAKERRAMVWPQFRTDNGRLL